MQSTLYRSMLYPDFTDFGDVFDRFSLVLYDIFFEPVNAVVIVSLAGKTPQVQAASSFESGLATSILLSLSIKACWAEKEAQSDMRRLPPQKLSTTKRNPRYRGLTRIGVG